MESQWESKTHYRKHGLGKPVKWRLFKTNTPAYSNPTVPLSLSHHLYLSVYLSTVVLNAKWLNVSTYSILITKVVSSSSVRHYDIVSKTKHIDFNIYFQIILLQFLSTLKSQRHLPDLYILAWADERFLLCSLFSWIYRLLWKDTHILHVCLCLCECVFDVNYENMS